jgi:hypothetical protein
MFSAFYSSENVISFSKTQETSFAPIDESLAYLAQLRPWTSKYSRFTSIEASHVLRNFRNEKCEFRHPKRKKPQLLQMTFL